MNSNYSNKSNKYNLANKRKKSIFKNNIAQVFNLISEKRSFFALILAKLLVQLYITYYVSENLKVDEEKNAKKLSSKFIAACIASLVIILVLAFITMPVWLKFILFSLFSGALGIILAFRKLNLDPKLFYININLNLN